MLDNNMFWIPADQCTTPHHFLITIVVHISLCRKPINSFPSVQPFAHFDDLKQRQQQQQQLQKQQGGRDADSATGTAVHLPPTADVGSNTVSLALLSSGPTGFADAARLTPGAYCVSKCARMDRSIWLLQNLGLINSCI